MSERNISQHILKAIATGEGLTDAEAWDVYRAVQICDLAAFAPILGDQMAGLEDNLDSIYENLVYLEQNPELENWADRSATSKGLYQRLHAVWHELAVRQLAVFSLLRFQASNPNEAVPKWDGSQAAAEKNLSHSRTMEVAKKLGELPDDSSGWTQTKFLQWASSQIGMSVTPLWQALSECGCLMSGKQGKTKKAGHLIAQISRYADHHKSKIL